MATGDAPERGTATAQSHAASASESGKAASGTRQDTLFIGGRWVAPRSADSGTQRVTDPSTGETIGSVRRGTALDVDDAVAAAEKAWPLWAARTVSERAALLESVAGLIHNRQEDLAAVVSAEMGAPLDNARDVQVQLATDVFEYYAKTARGFQWVDVHGSTTITHEPIGVVAAITPWNYPLYQIALKVAPALAAGCAVVLKPSDDAPLNAVMLAEIIQAACEDTGAPEGIFNLVTGRGTEIGPAMSTHPRVDMVSFTGSTAVGREVSAAAAATVKRVTLELGGKSAAVILDDVDDLSDVLRKALGNVFYNSGQTCTACTRILIPNARYDEAVSLAKDIAQQTKIGDPRQAGDHLGPIATRRQYDSIVRHLDSGVADGARLITGGVAAAADVPSGCERGNWIRPTVFADVPSNAAILHEEIFGPVATLIGYDDLDDAVDIANNSIYGLAAAVYASSSARAREVARRLRAGRVDLNGAAFDVAAPVGGYKQSGNGRELGQAGLLEYLEIKSIVS